MDEAHWADEAGSLDHRAYMISKARRLDRQFEERQEITGSHFGAAVVWFDGYMRVSDPATGRLLGPDDLAALVREGGGMIENTPTTRVTHTVAAALAGGKVRKLNSRKVGFSKPVVTPSWVVDCSAARRLLPHGPYLLVAPAPSASAFAVAAPRAPPPSRPEEGEEGDGDGRRATVTGAPISPETLRRALAEDDFAQRALADDDVARRALAGARETPSPPREPPRSSLGESPSPAASRSSQRRRDEEMWRVEAGVRPGDEDFARRVANGELSQSPASRSSQCRRDEAEARRLAAASPAASQSSQCRRDEALARRLEAGSPPTPPGPPPATEESEEPAAKRRRVDADEEAGAPLLRGVERFEVLGPIVADWMARVDPATPEPAILLSEVLASLVVAGRLADAASLVRLVEDAAETRLKGWRDHSRLLREVAAFLVAERTGGGTFAPRGVLAPKLPDSYYLSP
jgi:hypothetical protein